MIAQDIVNVTRENGGRFLRKASADEREQLGIPEETEEAWLLMDETAILEKAKQALRQKGQHHGSDMHDRCHQERKASETSCFTKKAKSTKD